MSRKPKHDRELFREAVADVKPLASVKHVPSRPKPKPIAKFTRADHADVLRESVADPRDGELETGEELAFRRPQVKEKVFRRLKRGQLSVREEMDLHGLTAAEAREALKAFIQECADRNIRCVRVIHGKGLRSGRNGPVLKRKLDLWLRRWSEVLAFATARPVDGGTGAIYVLLRDR